MNVLEREDVRQHLSRAEANPHALSVKDPVALYSFAFMLAALAVVVVAILALRGTPGAAASLAAVGVVLAILAQIFVIRRRVFAPSTVAEIVAKLTRS